MNVSNYIKKELYQRGYGPERFGGLANSNSNSNNQSNTDETGTRNWMLFLAIGAAVFLLLWRN